VPPDPSPPVSCSVVVPCRNGGATLARQLAALAEQSAPVPFEVIVADNGSTDDSVAVARGFAPLVQVVDASQQPGVNVARNAGIAASRGELVLLCDADDRVHPGWVAAYWRAYCDGVQLMGGSLRLVTTDGRELRWQRYLNDDLRFLPWPTGANCGFARSVLDTVGMLDPELRGGGDDTEFFWRAQLAGYELVHVGDAAVDYVTRPTLRGQFAQAAGFGRSQVQLHREFAGSGMPRARTLLDVSPVRRLVGRAGSDDGRRMSTTVVRFVGMRWGRLLGSWRMRHWYF